MFKTTRLRNGLQLITVPMQGTETVTVLVLVGTGSKYETKRQGGISHFLEHLFFKGTKKRPTTLDISMELDSIGSEFNAYTSKEYTGYYIKSDAGKLELSLDVVSDMLLNSKFDAKEIEREKGVILEENNMKLDNPMSYTEDLFETCLYGDTPAGRDIIGTTKTITSFRRKDFIDYLNKQYSVQNTTLCIAGNIKNLKKLETLANKYFADGKFKERGKNFQEKPKVVEKQDKPSIKLFYRKTDQAHMVLGVRTRDYTHKDKAALKLMAIILGGSMSSRMFINLRERKGLAYYVATQAEHYSDTGYIMTRAGVPVKKTDEAIRTILNEYKMVKQTLISTKELKRTKDMLRGRVAIRLEGSDNQAEWYARQAVMRATVNRTNPKTKDPSTRSARSGLAEIETPDEYLKLMEKVTSADIQRVAKEIFVNKGLNLSVIGPYKKKDGFKKILKF